MYTHKEYPKWIYKNGKGKIVQDSDEHEEAKQDGWDKSSKEAEPEEEKERAEEQKEKPEEDKNQKKKKGSFK